MLLMMKRINLLFLLLLVISATNAQTVSSKLARAFTAFEHDAQMVNGIASLYVVDAKTGKVVYEKNGQVGLAPASTQKVITSVTAYELLGKDFRYKTEIGHTGDFINGELDGFLAIRASGDPTLGSWRWEYTKEEGVMSRLATVIKNKGIKSYKGIIIEESGWASEAIPDGWIWQDIGNYYGAGAEVLNWRENQYDVALQSGPGIGSPVAVKVIKPMLYEYKLTSEAKAAAKGSGDNAYIYFPRNGYTGIIRGTIPASENSFVISGAMPSPKTQFAATLRDTLKWMGVLVPDNRTKQAGGDGAADLEEFTLLHTEYSPVLDSIIYWFNKKSINLYGEALVKTLAFHKKNIGSTDKGVEIIKDYWKSKGIPDTELNIVDGSGLSPLNRVTTKAQVTVLQYAQKQSWFKGLYNALPVYNNMRMKSGTIRNAKGFTGLHTAQDGSEYIFSFLVNNYNGSASAIVQKMYRVLDVLK